MGGQQPSIKLTDERGQGGSAVVYRAVWRTPETGSATNAAIKIGRDRSFASVFATEALACGLCRSPALPELLTFGLARIDGDTLLPCSTEEADADCLPYLALRWHEGQPLDPRAADASSVTSSQLTRSLAESLTELHALGLAHGDVKPANVIVGPAGCVLIDLGLACAANERAPRGGTPRYLAHGDRDLGDARQRDLLALGLLLAEMQHSVIADTETPLASARQHALTDPAAHVYGALLTPSPGARPSANWVLSCAAGNADSVTAGAQPAGGALPGPRQVRASYLRLRLRELGGQVADELAVTPWLNEAAELAQRALRLCAALDAPPPRLLRGSSRPLMPLDDHQRRRWLCALVGSAAAPWPLAELRDVDEPTLAHALQLLAARKPPMSWLWSDIHAAVAGEAGAARVASDFDGGALAKPEQLAKLSLRVAQLPVDRAALAAVERHAEQLPTALISAAADALRLAGSLGRARTLLVRRAELASSPIAADIHRRAGDPESAERAAEACIAAQLDSDGRARASRARVALDRGAAQEALERLSGRKHAATEEVAALALMGLGDRGGAYTRARHGLALATTPESRARLSATLAYVRQWADPPAARQRYQHAVRHAQRAGAVLEEASYRTGEAAACVDLGELEAAIATAERATVLWDEVLHQPHMAARAWLAMAAAYAGAGAIHEAERAADETITRARDARDTRAEAYALWTLCDSHAQGAALATNDRAANAAQRAHELLVDASPDDRLHAAARLLLHAPDAVDEAAADALATSANSDGEECSSYARMTWWGARAQRLQQADAAERSGQQTAAVSQILHALVTLAAESIPLISYGRALHAGCVLARRHAKSDVLQRLDSARQRAAQQVLRHNRGALHDPLSRQPWLQRAREISALDGDQALDLRQLVRLLSERHDVDALLDRVVDVLLLWTRAERGLLLLRESDSDGASQLVPRSARNLGRGDLQKEQLQLSTSLAQRALEEGEPVVAIDAMEELSDSYNSVHALKLRSVMALPLVSAGDALGVVYLDDRARRGAFGERELRWAEAVAPIAALAIADARAQAELRAAVARSEESAERLEQLLAVKETALDVAERELARSDARETRFRYDNIIGDSAAMRRVLQLIDRVAPTDVPALIRGSSGSGKELLARALHRHSPRSSAAFVSENCGALPETLLESALFGHVRGAFTGADRARSGLFEAAHNGTLFLDEIGEMSLGMQTKLLRVLEDNLVRPVGATRSRQVDVRIVAATHRDLEAMVASGAFREDLYYRLNVITIALPPLCERREDIPALVVHLLQKHAPDRRVRVSDEAMAQLLAHAWPGNVRQLENEVRRALLMSDGDIGVEDLSIARVATPADSAAAPRSGGGLTLKARVDQLEVELVTEALGLCRGNQTKAAKLLGISRYGLHKMIKRLGIEVQRG